MHVGSILVGLVLLAALGAVVARPWWRPAVARTVQTASDPREEYEILVAAIRDLDFDYRAGVITEADYRPLRDDLAARAVALMQALDRQPDQKTDTSIEAQIEAAVSALRAQRRPAAGSAHPDGAGAATCPECGGRVRAGSRFCARCGASLEKTCPDCRAPIQPDDRFCGTCGQSLVGKVVA